MSMNSLVCPRLGSSLRLMPSLHKPLSRKRPYPAWRTQNVLKSTSTSSVSKEEEARLAAAWVRKEEKLSRSKCKLKYDLVTACGSVPTREATYNLTSELYNPPEMALTFLGTGSMVPTSTRNVSSMALHINQSCWIFDCGEGTQHQFNKCKLHSNAVTRIFISHMHGDHFFGLPGFLCNMNSGGIGLSAPPVEIYGPPGLRRLLRAILKTTRAVMSYNYVVYELYPARKDGTRTKVPLGQTLPTEQPGLNVFAAKDGTWPNLPSNNLDTDCISVHAALTTHTERMPTFAFVLKEKDYPGSLDPTHVIPRLEEEHNKEYLRKRGVLSPKRVLRTLKAGIPVQLADGVVDPKDCVGPKKKGRKIAIVGDTCDSRQVASLAAGATLLVHEATNCFLQGHPRDVGQSKSNTFPLVLSRTLSRGHSIPQMAGAFAQAIGAESLALTHFSARYFGISVTEYNHKAQVLASAIAQLARQEYSGQVLVGHDFLTLDVRAPWAKTWSPKSSRTPHTEGGTTLVKIVPESVYKDCTSTARNEVSPELAATNASRAGDKFFNMVIKDKNGAQAYSDQFVDLTLNGLEQELSEG